MCKDYKVFDIDICDNKCLKIDCPYFYHDWEDYSWDEADGFTNWDCYDIFSCDIRHCEIPNTKCPLFGFTKNDDFKVNYI